jgi:hypothetical protein
MRQQARDVAPVYASASNQQIVSAAPGNAAKLHLTAGRSCVNTSLLPGFCQTHKLQHLLTCCVRHLFHLFSFHNGQRLRQFIHPVKLSQKSETGLLYLFFVERAARISVCLPSLAKWTAARDENCKGCKRPEKR